MEIFESDSNNLSFVEKQTQLEELFKLLDNQWELDPDLRRDIWKLYHLHVKFKLTLINK